jgi:curli production assembly/transport component CsgE
MKHLGLILFFLLAAILGFAQTDSVQFKIDSVQIKTTNQSLQNLLKKIQQQASKTKKDPDIEIDGLLINNTKTKNGNDFYELFYRYWNAPLNAHNYTIYILEKPYRLTTTIIEIKINEITVFQSFLQPRIAFIELKSQQAVHQTQTYLRSYEKILKQLEGEDLSGSGIY